jgi:hypothetical protein
MESTLPKMTTNRAGQTLIGIILSTAIFAILAHAIFTLTTSSFRLVSFSRARIGARQLAQEKIEQIRNMPYEDIGTVDGIPSGNLEQSENITRNGLNYTVNPSVIYIDDPFDGVSPADLLPTDFKRVRVAVSWEGLAASRTNPIVLVTDIAPRGVETTQGGGTLSILVFDANAIPVSQTTVTIEADSLVPPVAIQQQTNENGRLVIPGAPACNECYKITVTKNGYSTERTYSPSEVANPNKPYLSVVAGQVTESSFAIDKFSTLNIASFTDRLSGFNPLDSITFQIHGQKTIGTDSNDLPVYKLDKQFTTDSQGIIIITDVEWDNYAVIVSSTEGLDISGTNPIMPFSVLPDTNVDFDFALTAITTHRLLTIFADPSQTAIASVSATLSFGAYEETKITGSDADPDFGQAFFADLQDKNHNIEATAAGYLDHSSKVKVSEYTIEQIILNPQ